MVLVLAQDLVEFSWRYQLVAVITLPPAGILGISALLALRRDRRGAIAGARSLLPRRHGHRAAGSGPRAARPSRGLSPGGLSPGA